MSGIGETNLKLLLQQAFVPSSYQGVVGIGSDAQHVVDAAGGFAAGQWPDWGIQFAPDTITATLRGVWQKVTANTATTFALAAPLPAVPAPGDTFDIRPFGATVQNIQSIGGTAQTGGDWTPKVLGVAQEGTDATGVAAPAGAVGIRGWLSAIFNLWNGGTAKAVVSQPTAANLNATVTGIVTANLGTLNGAAQDGTDATGVVPPAGAVGIRGWLSAIYSLFLGGTAKVALPNVEGIAGQAAPGKAVLIGGVNSGNLQPLTAINVGALGDAASLTNLGLTVAAALHAYNGASFDHLRVDAQKNLLVGLRSSGGNEPQIAQFGGIDTAVASYQLLGTGAFLMGFNGATWDRLRVDAQKNLLTGIRSSAGNEPRITGSDVDGLGINYGLLTLANGYGFNGATWDRLRSVNTGQLVVTQRSSAGLEPYIGGIGDGSSVNMLGTGAFEFAYTGGGNWDRLRGANVYKPVIVTAVAGGAEATLWTPAAGKKFRLMGFHLIANTAPGYDWALRDGAGGITIMPLLLPVNVMEREDFGQGKLSGASNNALTLLNNSGSAWAGVLVGMVWGTEE
ncbi:MAG TPA: hypothetical protein VGK74_22210 [Symbiobacteriaceae bacterium]|jgi:hypothetical protein